MTSNIKKTCEDLKKHSRTGLDVQFKEFSLSKQKTRLRMDHE